MKNKKVVITSIIVVILLVVSLGVYYVFTKEDKNTTLNLLEKQWIESNKNKVIDMGIINEIPVFNYNGEGIFFDFLNQLEKDTGLEFNKVSYTIDVVPKSEYAFKIVDKKADNDILIYQDNYVLLTKNRVKYTSLDKIANLTIGVMDSDLDSVNTYLKGTNNVSFKTYDDINNLFSDMNIVPEENEEEVVESVIDAIILPKSIYLDKIIANENLNIAYNITELTKDYVLSLGNVNKLNDIISKYYKKWANDNYIEAYNLHFSSSYFSSKKIDEKEKVKFRSKRYAYGFVENNPYDTIVNDRLLGINNTLMKEFSRLADVEINYKAYPNIPELINDFNKNKLDFFFDNTVTPSYDMDTYSTVSVYDEKVVITSSLSNEVVVNSLNSLKNSEVMAIKGSQIAAHLADNDIKVNEFDNMQTLIKSRKNNSLIALDQVTYNYFSRLNLENNKIDYQFMLPSDYKFTIRDIKDNQVFSEFFDFYLSFTVEKGLMNRSYEELLNVDSSNLTIKNVVVFGGIAIVIIITTVIFLKKTSKKKKKKTTLTKEDKLRYIDMLTSLKNRNYLNDNIEKWDESEIYPQTIIVIDLNNVAYINDNYGHSEGDNVIKEAANILITNQIENSDIIRTNGNEFLVYLVGHDEKQIVSYIRKLNKEFKELDHGFGAAIGYSMITDAIKTVDDAVNEATLDMRNNKEEINN
jgi:diguanylate cyclase (GGDEF)-like protein